MTGRIVHHPLPQVELNTLSDDFASIVDDPSRPNVLVVEEARDHQESGVGLTT